VQSSPVIIVPSQLHIRNAERADLGRLEWEGEFLHYRRIFADTFQLTELGQAKIWISEINEDYLVGQLLVSLKGGRPELADGCTRAYVYGFRVRPAFRNQGIGKRMMESVETDLLAEHFQTVTLNVAKVNYGARRFYERLGYCVVGTDPGRWFYLDHLGFQHDVYEPAWRMEKKLSDTGPGGTTQSTHG